MFRILFLLFIIVPIIEISVLMQVGEWLGAWPTVAIVIVTAWLGAKNVRQQGIATLNSVQTKMAQGQMPSDEIVTGLLLLVAGVTLITPGFVTDAFGLLLLVPYVRKALVAVVQKHMVSVNTQQSSFGFHNQQFHQESPFEQSNSEQRQSPTINKGQTLEGEFERKE
jgi:UPF0716 protein FxsA